MARLPASLAPAVTTALEDLCKKIDTRSLQPGHIIALFDTSSTELLEAAGRFHARRLS